MDLSVCTYEIYAIISTLQLGIGHTASQDSLVKVCMPKSFGRNTNVKMVRCGDWGTAVVVSSQQAESKKWSRFNINFLLFRDVDPRESERWQAKFVLPWISSEDLFQKEEKNLFLLLSGIYLGNTLLWR